MIIIGIDPGINGAISIIENKKIIEVYDTPTMIDGKKNKRQINGAQVTNIFKERLRRKRSSCRCRTCKCNARTRSYQHV